MIFYLHTLYVPVFPVLPLGPVKIKKLNRFYNKPVINNKLYFTNCNFFVLIIILITY